MNRRFQSILQRMTGRLLRGETHGDTRPFEQLLPGLATAAEGGTTDAGNPPEAAARVAGLLRAAVVLARPAGEDGVVDLRDPKLAVSVRALFDQFLYSNSVYVLKALLRRGSELLRVTIGKVQWALRVKLVRDARQCAACLCQPYPCPYPSP